LSFPCVLVVSNVDAGHRLVRVQPQPLLFRHDLLGKGPRCLYIAVMLKMLQNLDKGMCEYYVERRSVTTRTYELLNKF
jgi:hypothetical protein